MKFPRDTEKQERCYKAIHRLNGNSDFHLFKELLTWNAEECIKALANSEGKDLHQAQGKYQFIEALLQKTGREEVRKVLDNIEANKK